MPFYFDNYLIMSILYRNMRKLLKGSYKVKLRLCDHCGNEFKPYNSLVKACGIPCAIELGKAKAKKDLENQVKREAKEWSLKKKEGLDNLKTKSDYEKDLEKEINHIVRLIDKGHECISSGKKNYKVNAGHFYSVGSTPALRFNLLNIFNQSVDDNMFRGGNILDYSESLRKTFGLEVSNEIHGLKYKYQILDLSIPELKEKIKIARVVVRKLIKENWDESKPYTTEERIEKRRFYNDLIGIYK